MVEVRQQRERLVARTGGDRISDPHRVEASGFRAVYVFDITQTEGKELPEFSERVSGNVAIGGPVAVTVCVADALTPIPRKRSGSV